MAKAIMSFKKIKSKAMFSKMMKHNFREDFCENVNKSLSYMNEVVVPMEPGETYKSAFEKKIYESPYYRDHSVRKNAVLALDVLMTFSSKNIPSDLDLEKWKKENVEWLNERFGKDNVISVVLHMDESVPHMHAIVVPMHEQKLNCSHFVSGKESMREMHDSYDEKMIQFGLERRQKYSVAKHEDVQKFYAAIEDAIVKELPIANEYETAEQYRERAQVAFRKANLQNLDKIKTLEAKVATTIGAGIEDKIKQTEVTKKYEEALKEIETLKKENKELSIKAERMDEIAYAIRHNIPSENEAAEFKATMISMAKIAQKQMQLEQAEKEKNIADDVLDPNK